MSGITGAIWFRQELAVQQDTMRAMSRTLQQRGPDHESYLWRPLRERPPYAPDPGIALGIQQLAVGDRQESDQPMANEDGSVHVIFDGEIYNYPSLRNRLERAGHTFCTRTGAEAIAHLYEDEGEVCFQHLSGMFAIAIYDARKQRVVLGRDRMGQKPLVYREEAGRLWFGSQLKSLLAAPGAPRELDVDSVDEFLTYGYVPHPGAILKGYRKLPPGNCAVFDIDGLKVQRYWQPDFNLQQTITEADAIAQLRELLTSSVTARMQCDVPSGAFLSGDLPSSLIAALMQQQSQQPVKTFSISFGDKEVAPLSYARDVAAHLKTAHHEFNATPDIAAMLPEFTEDLDEPLADSSAIAAWCVSKQSHSEIAVAFAGNGGSEVFAGHRRHQSVALAGWFDWASPAKAVLGNRLWQYLPAPQRFKQFCNAMNLPPVQRYLESVSVFNEQHRGALYTDEFLERLSGADPATFLEEAWSHSGRRDIVTQASLTDLQTHVPCGLNTAADIASMAHGLLCRQPFLDHRVVEFAAGLPIQLKFRNRHGGLLLRKAFGELLPAAIWNRRPSTASVPIAPWLRNQLKPLLEETLLSDPATTRGIFRSEAVKTLIDQHYSGKFDHSGRLWALLMLELWQQSMH